jgi:hypothetical protein
MQCLAKGGVASSTTNSTEGGGTEASTRWLMTRWTKQIEKGNKKVVTGENETYMATIL